MVWVVLQEIYTRSRGWTSNDWHGSHARNKLWPRDDPWASLHGRPARRAGISEGFSDDDEEHPWLATRIAFPKL